MSGISKKKRIRFVVIFVIITTSLFLSTPSNTLAKEFKLKLRSYCIFSHEPFLNGLNILKNQLRVIGIDLEVIPISWPDYIWGYYRSDISLGSFILKEGIFDPDFSRMYSEDSIYSGGYSTDMDWDKELETGLNEWYLQTGKEIIPPQSEERIQHYWKWQNHYMQNILTLQPLLIKKEFQAIWNNLHGYNSTDGLGQSWGKIYWNGSHYGQEKQSEIVVNYDVWEEYNPLDLDETEPKIITDLILDPLIWFDSDASVHPHLLNSFNYIDNDTLELNCRQGIKWASDPDGNFTNECFDVEDVIFTLNVLKNMSYDTNDYFWIDKIEKLNNYTLRININPIYMENKRYKDPHYFSTLAAYVLPEHYLNQTQIGDGVTPDISHSSWEIFKDRPFGTGLFEINKFNEYIGMNLTVRPDCWWLNSSITSDPNLDWLNRFGDFSGGLTNLRVKYFEEYRVALDKFLYGKIDIIDVDEPIEEYILNPQFETLEKLAWYCTFLIQDCRPQFQLGNRDPCPGNSSISIGLAIRKAIAHVIDKQELNDFILSGNGKITNYPIFERLSIWCNPNIIRYDRDLEKARYYMNIAGLTYITEITGIDNYLLSIITFSVIVILVLTTKNYNQRKNKKGRKYH